MVINQLRINAVTREERTEMISQVKEAMTASGAWVLDVRQFSNVSVCFSFEMPGRKAARLRDELVAIGLHLMEDGDDSPASVRDQSGSDSADVTGTLQITFIHNEPDLRIEVPAIPG
jgi:hypothetical protein